MKQIYDILSAYKERFEKSLPEAFLSFGQESKLKEAIVYALSNGGKRFRPALVFMVAEAVNSKADVSKAALTVEYFHTASLIADDLPCMDDDDERRGKPTVHKVFGEAIALLASYSLIAQGFEQIAENGYAVTEAARKMGSCGLIGGQFFDLFPKGFSEEEMLEMFHMKTVSLFDLSMVLGWLFAGGAHEKIPLVQKAAFHFGIAFQILDDIDDMSQDIKSSNPSNYAVQFGKTKAALAVQEHAQLFSQALKELGLQSTPLSFLAKFLASSSSATTL
jgi:geranylgeranyl diphosphate synthase type II